MDKFVIEGGHPLRGSVAVAGSKNAVLPVMAASLLTDEPVSVPNAPRVADVKSMLDVLADLGSRTRRDPDGRIEMCSAAVPKEEASWDLVRKMRGSIAVLGPLLARTGRAVVSVPGGCVIGVRPIDLHLKGMEALGAKVSVEHGYVHAEAPRGGLRGDHVYLGGAQGPTVLGTANVMMAATLAKGRTVIHGAACEPEVVDLGECLVAMGARIAGLGSPRIEIEGVQRLHGVVHSVIPDRIEAGTFVIAGAMTGGKVRVEKCRSEHLQVLFEHLGRAGIQFHYGDDWIETVPYDTRSRRPRPTDVTTFPYPFFPTDLQAQWMALMTLAAGMSIVTETIFPDRYMHVAELQRMAANVRRQGASAIVLGPADLSGAQVTASDLRASAALVLAGLIARGVTEVHRVYHIDRGYERIEERLGQLGAKIQRVDSKSEPSTDEPPPRDVIVPRAARSSGRKLAAGRRRSAQPPPKKSPARRPARTS